MNIRELSGWRVSKRESESWLQLEFHERNIRKVCHSHTDMVFVFGSNMAYPAAAAAATELFTLQCVAVIALTSQISGGSNCGHPLDFEF